MRLSHTTEQDLEDFNLLKFRFEGNNTWKKSLQVESIAKKKGLNCTSILEIIVFSSSVFKRSCGERIFKYEKPGPLSSFHSSTIL
jgi:hypothetical protein